MQIDHSAKTILFKEHARLKATRAVVAYHDNFGSARQFGVACRDTLQRHQDRGWNVADGKFPWLAHIKQHRGRLRTIGEPCIELGGSNLIHGFRK